MLDNFVGDFKNNYSNYGLVFRYIKWQYNLFRFSLILLVLVIIGLSICWATRQPILVPLLILMTTLIFSIINFFIFNHNAKKTVKKRYGILPTGFLWNNNAYFEFSNNQLLTCLKKYKWKNDSKLRILIELLNKEADRRKLPPLMLPGVFLAFTIPIWDKVLNYFYKPGNNLDSILQITIISLVLAILFVVIFTMLTVHYGEMKDDLLNSDSQLMKQLSRRLEHILLEIPNSKD